MKAPLFAFKKIAAAAFACGLATASMASAADNLPTAKPLKLPELKYEKYTLDTHDHPVLDPVWQIYAEAIRLSGQSATLLEWDDRIPSFDEVHREALKANRFIQSCHGSVSSTTAA